MLDANGEVHEIKAAAMRIIASAYALAPGDPLPMEELKDRTLADVARIEHGTQGNRPPGSQMSKGDKAMILEGALRRGIEILNPTD